MDKEIFRTILEIDQEREKFGSSRRNKDGFDRWHVYFSRERRNWKKKACGLIITDQAKKRDVLTHVVRDETLENALRILWHLKELGINPGLITCDFSPILIAAITQVYGEAVIQIDLFHVMQELNRGIKADLKQYREQRFDAERRELRILRNRVNSIQKILKEGKDFRTSLTNAGALPKIKPSHEFSSKCLIFTKKVIKLIKIPFPDDFFQSLQRFMVALPTEEPYTMLINKIAKYLPKKRFTEKGMNRVKTELLKKIKTFYLWFRKPMDEESIQFYHDFHIIFVQPERMTPKRKLLLDEFLITHPELKQYREMTLLVGELSRLPPEEINGHQIDDLREDPSFSKKLNTAIKTIKKYKSFILRFVEFFKKNPNFSKAQHSNMEYYNLKFKEPFKSGNNLLKKERVLGRLDTQLSGKIEWYLEDKVII